jgi:hypothetical protein
MEKEIKVHCWADYKDTLKIDSQEWVDCIVNDSNATCLLEHGHEGPHAWTPDKEITISFKAGE